MTNLNRRGFLKGAAIAAAGAAVGGPWLSNNAFAAEHTLKYANNLPLTHPMNIRAKQAAERIKKETNGQVEIQIYPNNVLGGDTEMLGQVRAGAIQFFTLSGLILSTLVPPAAINGIGFAFKDYDSVWAAMDGKLGAYIRSAISKHGLVAFDKIWDNGFREITTSTHPIRTPKDLKGFKIRVPVSPLWTSMFEALQSSPTSINFAEVYSALQTQVVDGQENPLAIIETAKLYEVQKYCSVTNHMWDGFWFLANKPAWEGLPDDVRGVITKNFNQAGLEERDDVAKLNASLRGKLEEQGLTFNEPDTQPFRDKLRQSGFYAQWKKKFGDEAWGLLEEYSGSLA